MPTFMEIQGVSFIYEYEVCCMNKKKLDVMRFNAQNCYIRLLCQLHDYFLSQVTCQYVQYKYHINTVPAIVTD